METVVAHISASGHGTGALAWRTATSTTRQDWYTNGTARQNWCTAKTLGTTRQNWCTARTLGTTRQNWCTARTARLGGLGAPQTRHTLHDTADLVPRKRVTRCTTRRTWCPAARGATGRAWRTAARGATGRAWRTAAGRARLGGLGAPQLGGRDWTDLAHRVWTGGACERGGAAKRGRQLPSGVLCGSEERGSQWGGVTWSGEGAERGPSPHSVALCGSGAREPTAGRVRK
jgi:hypothetical protein